MAPTNKEVANLKINTLKKKKYESLLEAGLINEDELYMVVDNNAKTEYGDLYGDIENQKDLDNALYASRLHLKDMSNDVRGYAVVEALNTRPIEFNKSKFTKVGYPIIDKEGIASGFTHYDYIKPIEVPRCRIFEIKLKVTTSIELYEGGQVLLTIDDQQKSSENMHLFVSMPMNGKNIYFKHNSPDINVFTSYEELQPNTTYFIKIIGDGENINVYMNQEGFIDEMPLLGSTLITSDMNGILTLGSAPYGSKGDWRGSIDLKEFEVYANGELIFTGWDDFKREDTYTLPSEQVITIPYTLSKDGARIVDVAYKHLVDQLYAETGKGNYIIIDETNKTFRLPTPDIYSLLEQKAAVITFRKWEEE